MTVTDGLPPGLVERVQHRLAEDRLEPSPQALARAVRAEGGRVVSDQELVRWLQLLEGEFVGAGPLAPLLEEADVTDIVVNGCQDVRVDRGNGWEPTGLSFPDDESVQRLARRLATAAGRRLDDAHPFVDARLVDGTRLHAVLPALSVGGTCLSLRVLRPATHDLDTLAGRGALPGITETVLRRLVAARVAFLVSGGTGCGKTTLLAALLALVDPGERIVTVEDAEELRPPHPHLIRLVARPANVEGAGGIELRELVRQALRMRPDRIVIGEVRGAEVIDLLGALNTGHDGGAGTVHANRVAEVPARIEALAAIGGMPRDAVHAQLIGAFRVVVHLTRDAGGRRVSEIGIVRRQDDGRVVCLPAVVGGRAVEPGHTMLEAVLTDGASGARAC